jgi:hypothetical protein
MGRWTGPTTQQSKAPDDLVWAMADLTGSGDGA